MKEGTSAVRNVQDLQAEGKTMHERRFGEPLKGQTLRFGAVVEYHPIEVRDQFWQESVPWYLSWM